MVITGCRQPTLTKIGASTIRKLNATDKERIERVRKKREKKRLRRIRQHRLTMRLAPPTGVSRFLEWYASKIGQAKHRQPREIEIEFPEVFSLIDDPDSALTVLERLLKALRGGSNVISVHQDRCSLIDHGAECAFSAIALEANRKRIHWKGRFPANTEQRDIVLAAGIPVALGVPMPRPAGFYSFKLRQGMKEKERPYRSTAREKTSAEVTAYFNVCLNHYGHELSGKGLEYLSALLSEVIGNAEEHSGRRKWWIGAYMRRQTKKQGDCHVTMFSFGKTLYQSLRDLPEGCRLRRDIEKLVHEHTRRRLFRPRSWTEEDLWTLYALQEGVSRFNREASLGDRGVGTADMIEFFQYLGQHSDGMVAEPRMCVLSGSTHVTFDNRYQMKEQQTEAGESRRIIAFNQSNRLSEPPAASHVKHLDRYFPGTMISMRFFIDDSCLQALEDDDDEPN